MPRWSELALLARKASAAPTLPQTTSAPIAEPFTNPPGYNSLSANIAMLKAGGKRGGFVRAFSVLAGQSNSWVDRTLPDLALN